MPKGIRALRRTYPDYPDIIILTTTKGTKMFILDWMDENLDFEAVGPAFAIAGVVVAVVLGYFFG